MEGNVYDFNGTFHRELMLDLFSYLPFKELLRVSAVCRYWGELTADSSLTREVEFTPQDDVGTQQVFNLLEGKRHIRKLTLLLRQDAVNILELVSQNSQRLSHVSVSGVTFTDSAVKSLTDNCTLIRELRFQSCNLMGCDLSYFSNLKHLRSICLADSDVDYHEVVELVKGCSLLEELNVESLSFSAQFAIRSSLLRIISSTSDTLKHLRVDYPGEEVLQQVCRKELRILYCMCTFGDAETQLRSVFSMENLVWLRIGNPQSLASFTWNKLFQTHQLLNLRHLDLSMTAGIENCHLKTIGERFSLLSFLSICNCQKITDEGIFLLMESIKSPLEFLLAARSRITGICFSKIPEKLPHLILLDVGFCYEIDTSLLSDLQLRMPALAVRYSNEGKYVANARYQEVRNHKELKLVDVSLKDVEELYKTEKTF